MLGKFQPCCWPMACVLLWLVTRQCVGEPQANQPWESKRLGWNKMPTPQSREGMVHWRLFMSCAAMCAMPKVVSMGLVPEDVGKVDASMT